jgi:hypothetical protein
MLSKARHTQLKGNKMRFITLATALAVFAAADTAQAGDAGPVAEIVTFRLIDGGNPIAFSAAANGMAPFLNSTGAVLSRTLSVDETGLWTDHITWTSLQAARSAASQMMEQPAAPPFIALIDPDSVEMRHAPIRYTMKPE